MKVTVIPIIIGALGTTPKGVLKGLEDYIYPTPPLGQDMTQGQFF